MYKQKMKDIGSIPGWVFFNEPAQQVTHKWKCPEKAGRCAVKFFYTGAKI